MERTDAAIRQAGHRGTIDFRPPNGKKLVVLPWWLHQHHRRTITWDVAVEAWDGSRQDAATIVRQTVARVRPGSIVLLHPWNGRRTTQQAISMVVEQLRAQGYTFVTADDLLHSRSSANRPGTTIVGACLVTKQSSVPDHVCDAAHRKVFCNPCWRSYGDPVDSSHPPGPEFLEPTMVIDHDDPAIRALHGRLARQATSEDALVRLVFEYVRDGIRHSLDHGDQDVTCVASDVLGRGTGLCYAKSHLAAALYRRSGIPAGFVYQRLHTQDGPVLHGLVAILQRGGWRRLDVRGVTPALPSRYLTHGDVLSHHGDRVEDLPDLLAHPAPSVIRALSTRGPLGRVALPADIV